jgi:hypothetical protein
MPLQMGALLYAINSRNACCNSCNCLSSLKLTGHMALRGSLAGDGNHDALAIYNQLTNLSTLSAIHQFLPLMEFLRILIKNAQVKDSYVQTMVDQVSATITALHELYVEPRCADVEDLSACMHGGPTRLQWQLDADTQDSSLALLVGAEQDGQEQQVHDIVGIPPHDGGRGRPCLRPQAVTQALADSIMADVHKKLAAAAEVVASQLELNIESYHTESYHTPTAAGTPVGVGVGVGVGAGCSRYSLLSNMMGGVQN